MKKAGFAIAIATLYLFVTGCSKEAVTKPETTTPRNTDSKASNSSTGSINSVNFPEGYLGDYTVQDEKTIFIGQANPRGTNVFLNLSYLQVPTTITPFDNKHLTMPYGAGAYPDSGWAYIIGYDAASHSITLAPNEAMINDIVANSFEVLTAVYDPKTKEGSFVTRFTALKENGNETQLSESFFK